MKRECDAEFFAYRCPYTDKPCYDWDCDDCEVEAEERAWMKGERMTNKEAIEWLERVVQDVIHAIEDDDRNGHYSCFASHSDAQKFKQIVNDLPSAERKHGKWIVLYDENSPQDGIWKCSICGYIRLIDNISPTNFCPNCGAKMDERREDVEAVNTKN